jgi:hypothetical protein
VLLLVLRFRPQGILPEPKRTTVAHDVLDQSGAGD